MSRIPAIPISKLSSMLNIPADHLITLASAGYLRLTRLKARQRRPKIGPSTPILKAFRENPAVKLRVIDRHMILDGLLGLTPKNGHVYAPRFDKQVEIELMRIAQLPELARMEQGIKLLMRWNDAEKIADAILQADVATVMDRIRVEREVKSRASEAARLKYRARVLAGQVLPKKLQEIQNQLLLAQAKIRPPASQLVPRIGQTGQERTLPRLAWGSGNRPTQHPDRH